MAIVCVSFVVFMGSGPGRSGGGRADSNFGTIYGKAVTPEEYARTQREFYLYYWLHYGTFPDRNANVKRTDIDRETYLRMLLVRKAQALGIHISKEAVVAAGNELLRNLGRNGQTVPLEQFVSQVLAREGLTLADFQNFLRADLTIQQLVATLGLSGSFVTPQEAGHVYDREHQEVSAQAVFFSVSNYLADVTVTPVALGDFYQKNMASYREPDRVQVNYVAFPASNYLAQAKTELTGTNFNDRVDAAYAQYGQTEFADAKTPEEAKAKIRDVLYQQRTLEAAKTAANDFAKTLFAQEPVKAENLAALAKQKGLTLAITAPFNSVAGPEEFNAPITFTKAAFKLTADEPLAGPVPGIEAVYVLALAKQIPTSIPPLNEISARVTEDFKIYAAVMLAQQAGTNFQAAVTAQMAAGKTFGQAAIGVGHPVEFLKPFSLSSQEVPEAGDRVDIRQLKQAAFTTPVGRATGFIPTMSGGFLLFNQALMPVDLAKKTADMPQFLTQVRRARQNEAFNLWLQAEAGRELRNTPIYAELAGKTAPR